MKRLGVSLQGLIVTEADEKRAEAGRIFARIEVFCWLLLIVLGAAGTLLLRNCDTLGSNAASESAHLTLQREWQLVFENQSGQVLLDATILSQPISGTDEPEVLFKLQSEKGGFSGVFIAAGEPVELEQVPLSMFCAISVEDLRDLMDSESLCLEYRENMCLSEESRRKTRMILDELP